VKLYKGFFVVAALVLLLCTEVYAEVVDKIIVVVNDEVITLSELNAAFEPYRRRIEESYKGTDKETVMRQNKEVFLQRFIDNMLIEQEAKKTGTSIKDEEVMEVLKDSLARQNTKMEDFLKKLEKDGNSLETVKKEIRGQIMRMRLLRREIKAKILISDQEIGEYYDKHRGEYEGKEAVRVKQILLALPKDADQTTKARIKEQAQQILKTILGGEPFDLVAAKYSQGPATVQGGDLGFIERGVTIQEVEAVAFSLPVEKVSAVIESSLGFHIIKVVDKRGAGIKPFEAVREEIKAKLEDEKLEKKYDEWIATVRKKSFIDIRL
jgi:peptidyl-prolyl cis-trans isomerase SurA